MFQPNDGFLKERTLWLLYLIAACSFLPAVNFYYVGEEAIFPISSLEMWHSQQWLVQLLYGVNVRHNPLFNWLIIACCNLVGWEYMLQAARGIAIVSTIGSSLILFWLTGRLFGERKFAVFAALAYLTLSDVALYHGWLAYVDPLYSFFIFGAIALLWVSAEEQRAGWLLLAVLSLSLAFLSKAFTAYVFYGVAALVLLKKHWRFLLRPASLLLHLAALGFPLLWFSLLPSAGQGSRMMGEIAEKLALSGSYAQQFFGFPFEVMARLLPLLLLAGYYFLRRRVRSDASNHFGTLVAIALVNFLPYWISPQSGIRYLLPIFPLFALILARILWRTDAGALKTTIYFLAGFIALKWVAFLFVFPWYQSHYRGENYYFAAQEINRLAEGFPLYSKDVSASGLSVTGYLDVMRLPQAPLTYPPEQWDDGYVVSYSENPELGKTFLAFPLGGDTMYLLCRGRACEHRMIR